MANVGTSTLPSIGIVEESIIVDHRSGSPVSIIKQERIYTVKEDTTFRSPGTDSPWSAATRTGQKSHSKGNEWTIVPS